MKTIIIPVALFAILGALGGWAAIKGRGSVEIGGLHISGWQGIAVTSAIMAAIGLILGITIWLLMRALKIAQNMDADK